MRTVLPLVLLAACADTGPAPEPLAGIQPAFGTSRDDYSNDMFFQGPFGWFDAGEGLFCEPGTWAQGFRISVEPDQKSGDDTAMNGISLSCYKPNGDFVERIDVEDREWGEWSDNARRCPGDGNFIKGARMRIEDSRGGDIDDTGANDLEFACRFGGKIVQDNGGTWGEWRAWQFCDEGSFVCGVMTGDEDRQGDGDDTALNSALIRCCDL